MSEDKSVKKEDLTIPEKEQKIMQPEEYIQKKGNLEKDKSDDSPMPGAPDNEDHPVKRQ